MTRIRYEKVEDYWISKDTFLIAGGLWRVLYDESGFAVVNANDKGNELFSEQVDGGPNEIKKRIKFVLKSSGVVFEDEIRRKHLTHK